MMAKAFGGASKCYNFSRRSERYKKLIEDTKEERKRQSRLRMKQIMEELRREWASDAVGQQLEDAQQSKICLLEGTTDSFTGVSIDKDCIDVPVVPADVEFKDQLILKSTFRLRFGLFFTELILIILGSVIFALVYVSYMPDHFSFILSFWPWLDQWNIGLKALDTKEVMRLSKKSFIGPWSI